MKVIRKATIADVEKIFKKIVESKLASTQKCPICRVSDG
jgi:hypothetical protein